MTATARLFIRLPPHHAERERKRKIERELANEIALDRIGTLKPERKLERSEAFRRHGDLPIHS